MLDKFDRPIFKEGGGGGGGGVKRGGGMFIE